MFLPKVNIGLIQFLDLRKILEQYLGNQFVALDVFVRPAAGVVGIVPVVAQHEIAAIRHFVVLRFFRFHRFMQIRLVERCVGYILVFLAVDFVDRVARHTDDTFDIVRFDAFRFIIRINENGDVTPLRISEFVA